MLLQAAKDIGGGSDLS